MGLPTPGEFVGLTSNDDETKTLTVRLSTRSVYELVVSSLLAGRTYWDDVLVPHHWTISADPPDEPAAFPCQVSFLVHEKELPAGDAPFGLFLANSFLVSNMLIEALAFEEPASFGEQGVIRLRCESRRLYDQLRRFLDEPHGTFLLRPGDGHWYVRRLDDNCDPEGFFPQDFDLRVEWLRPY